MAVAERQSAQIGAAALYAGGSAAAEAATMGAGTTLLTGLAKVGDLAVKAFPPGPETATPTGDTAATNSQATARLPTGVGQTSGVGSSY
jgi:hypothetical protein